MKIKNVVIYAEKDLLRIISKSKKSKKVRDHCHFTGKYRGAAHNKCNMNYKITKDIPVIFHNGSIYGYYLIIKELVKEFEGELE